MKPIGRDGRGGGGGAGGGGGGGESGHEVRVKAGGGKVKLCE